MSNVYIENTMFLLVDNVLTEEEIEELKKTPLTRYNLSETTSFDMGEPSESVQKKIAQISENLLALYTRQFHLDGYVPLSYGYEGAKVKKYSDNDGFDWHADAVDPRSCRRQLGFLWYLGGEYEGGETVFQNGMTVKNTKPGDVLLFPPFWLFPHKGNPVKGEKWIMTSYLTI